MGIEGKEAKKAEGQVEWLEDELRQTKAHLHKVEHQLEQLLNQVWNLEGNLRRVEETMNAVGVAGAALPGLQEELRQVKDQIARLNDRHTAFANRAEEVGRQRQAEVERERQERAALVKQVENLAKGVGQYDSRIQAVEDSGRHLDEDVGNLRLSHKNLVRDLEELTSRAARNLEAALRAEQEIGRVTGEQDSLHQNGLVLAERLNLLLAQLQRDEGRLDKLESYLDLPQEIKDQMNRGRFEREQMAERLTSLERSTGELLEQTREFTEGVARLQVRSDHHGSALLAMTEELRQHRQLVADQLKRLARVMERQRRRQAESLAEEIKELSRSEFKPEE